MSSMLITGGTGSFGRAFVRRLLREPEPERIVVYSRGEVKQYEMAQELPDPRLRFVIGDVRDKDRLSRAATGVDTIVHAAALKHVPIAESNPFECIKTNIHGAMNVIDVALDRGVARVVALSTDKAVMPIGLYGASKLVSDKLFVTAQSCVDATRTRFSVVRYGNVIGSRGSVIPFFLRQRHTGVIPITDRRMTRFWITPDQGVGFVSMALRTMRGGELFVPKIPSMRIVDLAAAIAHGCELKEIGIRPGEKLHETMIPADDAPRTLDLDDHYVVCPEPDDWAGDNYEGAKRVPERFEYSSDRNAEWLTVERMRAMIDDLRLGASGDPATA